MKKILFVCVHNSGRSQMAEAFFNHLAQGKAVATSAGTLPAESINPAVVKAMREVGFDTSRQQPKLLTLEMLENADRVITMGCNVADVCPASLVPTEDWALDDPEGKTLKEVRRIRDEVRTRVQKLINEL